MYVTSYKILKRIFVVLVIVALITIVFATTSINTKASDESTVRVKLSVGTPSTLNFSLYGNYGIDQDPSLNLSTGSYKIEVDAGVLKLFAGSMLLYAGNDIYLHEETPFEGEYNYTSIKTTTYGTNKYLGEFRFKLDSNHVDVINHVYLDYYLYGVVPHEMSNSWPIEALKTQAVAARTYAVRYMGGGSYDMVDTSANQVYWGFDETKTNAIRAVNETAKTVLMSNGTLVPTYYSASNGGQVDIPQHVWSSGATVMPYHIIHEDTFDVANAWSKQEVLIIPKAFTDIEYQYRDSGKMVTGAASQADNAERYLKISAMTAVAQQGYIANVTGDITISSVNSIVATMHQGNHGLIDDYNGTNTCICYKHANVNLTVLAQRNSTEEEEKESGNALVTEEVIVEFGIDMHEFDKSGGLYQAFKDLSLRLFVVEETDTSYNIYHRRFGHGLGMSQRSAQERAKAGHSFVDILTFYFPNTYLEELAISPPDQSQGPPVNDASNATIINCNNNVNVRSTPNTDNPSIGSVNKAARITVTQQFVTDTWHKIDYNGVEAYVYAYYVDLDQVTTPTPTVEPTPLPTATTAPTPVVTAVPTPIPTPTPPSDPTIIQKGKVWANVLNVRSGAGTSFSKVANLTKNASVSIIELEPVRGWHKIWYDNQIAYVYAKYIEISDSADIVATGVITASVLNIRTGPSTSYSKVGMFGKGDKVDITKLNYANSWHELLYNGKTVYVHANYVSVDGASDNSTKVSYATVNASALNFRQSASTGSKILNTLKRGDVVQLLEKAGAWHRVKYGGQEGYMYAKFLDVSSTVYGKVDASVLNVRSGAGTSYSILGKLKRGDIVQVTKSQTNWHKIVYKSSAAYVYAAYIDVQ